MCTALPGKYPPQPVLRCEAFRAEWGWPGTIEPAAMRFGFRHPSLRKRIAARTWKRVLRHSLADSAGVIGGRTVRSRCGTRYAIPRRSLPSAEII